MVGIKCNKTLYRDVQDHDSNMAYRLIRHILLFVPCVLGQSLRIGAKFTITVTTVGILCGCVTNTVKDPINKVYWEWQTQYSKSSSTERLESALSLLNKDASHDQLYLAVSGLCAELNRETVCIKRLQRIEASSEGYAGPSLDLALGRLSAEKDSLKSAAYFMSAASSPALSPGQARILVDDAVNRRSTISINDLQTIWVKAAKTEIGQRFGLAYTWIQFQSLHRAEMELLSLAARRRRDPEIYRELARIYFLQGDRDKCLEYASRGVEAAVKAGNIEAEIIARGNLVYAHSVWNVRYHDNEKELAEIIRHARNIGRSKTVAVSFLRLAEIEVGRLNYVKAIAYLDSSYHEVDKTDMSTYSNVISYRGEVLRRTKQYTSSELDLIEAVRLSTITGDTIVLLSSVIYLVQLYATLQSHANVTLLKNKYLTSIDSSNIHDYKVSFRLALWIDSFSAGRYEHALQYIGRANEIMMKTKLTNRYGQVNRALAYTYACLNDLAMAEYYYDLSLGYSTNYGDSLSLGLNHYGLAKIFLARGEYDIAENHINKCIEYLGPYKYDSVMLDVHGMLSDIYIGKGDLNGASSILTESLKLAHDDRGKVAIDLAWGRLALSQGNNEQALRYFDQATSRAQRKRLMIEPWTINEGRAIALWRLGRLRMSERAFKEAIAYMESRRSGLVSIANRAQFYGVHYSIHNAYASFLDMEGRHKQAIDVSEGGRNRSLVDLMHSISRSSEPAGPAEGRLQLSKRSYRLSEMHAGSSQRDSTVVVEVMSQLRESKIDVSVSRMLDQIQGELMGNGKVHTGDVVSVSEVQKMIGTDEAILMYRLGPQYIDNEGGSVVYLIKSDSIAFVPLSVSEDIDVSISALVAGIAEGVGRDSVEWKKHSRTLYDALVYPAMRVLGSSIKHLHIIPDGNLSLIPFACLLDLEGRYLIERVSLSYSPSMTSLKLSRMKNTSYWETMLVVADPSNDLPGARHEASIIVKKQPEDRNLLLGEAATKTSLYKLANNYDIIHIAAHGSFEPGNLFASYLRLNDGYVTVSDIGRLRLSAYLVTLSGCETALGSIIAGTSGGGVEWFGFYEAFLAAGASSVLASTWAVHDRYSASFMSRFYEQLEGGGKAMAIAKTQRSFIDDARTAHPYYWAAFRVLGDYR